MNESTLGTVPDAATVGGHSADELFKPFSSTGGSCDPTSTTPITCATFDTGFLNAQHRVLALIRFEWYANTTGGSGGRCVLASGIVNLDEAKFGDRSRVTDSSHPQVVTLVSAFAAHEPFVLRCAETDADVRIQNIRIAVVSAPL